MDLILLRHLAPMGGEGRCYGRTDLAAGGDLAARARALASLARPARIVTSPLRRCRDLARLLGARFRVPVTVDPAWVEIDFGTWEGVPWDRVPRAEIDAWAADLLHARAHGGESVAMLLARTRRALRHTPAGTLVVTHAGAMRAALVATGAGPGAWQRRIGYGEAIALGGKAVTLRRSTSWPPPAGLDASRSPPHLRARQTGGTTMDALEFLLTRRSRPAKLLKAPAPGRDELLTLLTAAARVPDHGKLEPWRFVVIEGAGRDRLAAAIRARAAEAGQDADKGALAFEQAPLTVAVVGVPKASEKAPAIEQVLSAGAAALSLVNAALAAGWGASWLTGWPAYDRELLAGALGLAPDEWLAGFVHIGTCEAAPPERPRPDVPALVTWLDA